MGILHGGATEGRLHALSACSAFSVRLSLRWLAMLDSQRMLDSQCSARNAQLAMCNVIPNAQLAMLSSPVTVPGPTEARIALPRLEVLGSKRSGSQRSARVALLRLKVSGSQCQCDLMSRVRGNPSSRASDRLLCENRGSLKYLTFERAHGWQGSRLAIYQKLPSKRT